MRKTIAGGVAAAWAAAFAGCSSVPALMSASAGGDDARIAALLFEGADVNATSDGASALDRAALWAHLGTVRLLLDRGARPGSREAASAAAGGDAEILRLILSRLEPADAKLAAESSLRVLALVYNGLGQRVKVNGLPVRPWGSGADRLDALRRIVGVLMGAGADVDAPGKDGFTPLAWAARERSADLVRVLLEAGADADAASGDANEGPQTPAAAAEGLGFDEIATMLRSAEPASARAARWAGIAAAAQARPRYAAALESEARADKAARRGRKTEAVSLYEAVLKSGVDAAFERRVREKLLKTAASMAPKPEVPAEAQQRVLRGRRLAKVALSVADSAAAAEEFRKAVDLAPWWAEAYRDLGSALAGAGRYEEAAADLRLYLAGAPDAPDSARVRSEIASLRAVR